MGYNIKLKDYENWAEEEKQKGNTPCLKGYIEKKIKKISAQEANNQRWDKTTMIKI